MLITKLRSANNVETQQYRKASKALLVLIPLLGVTYVLVLAGPEEGHVANIFTFARAFLLSSQVTLYPLNQNDFYWEKNFLFCSKNRFLIQIFYLNFFFENNYELSCLYTSSCLGEQIFRLTFLRRENSLLSQKWWGI